MREEVLDKENVDDTDASFGLTLPKTGTITAEDGEWRWRSEDSNGWRLVQNEEHAKLLISSVDGEWPWVELERGFGDDVTYCKVSSCEFGVVIEVNAPFGKLSRLYKRKSPAPAHLITNDNLFSDVREVYDNEVFSVEKADVICLQWLTVRRLVNGIKTRPVRDLL